MTFRVAAPPRLRLRAGGLFPPRLQLVVPELSPGFGERPASVDRRADLLLDGVDFLGGGQTLVLVRARDNEDAVRITAEQIARGNPRVADGHDDVGAFHLDAILAGA